MKPLARKRGLMMQHGVSSVGESRAKGIFTRRAVVLGGAQSAVVALLVGRLGYLGVAEHERYKLLSAENRIQTRLLPPRRGWIVDRHGKPLAINRVDFRVDIIPDKVEDPETLLRQLTWLLQLSAEDVDRVQEELKSAAGYQPVPVAENLPYEKYAAVTVRLPELAGAEPMRGFGRFYPQGAAVGHLLGYVGTPSREEYEAEDKNRLLMVPGFKIGKQSLEQAKEQHLRGRPGVQRAEVTSRGKLVRELSTIPEQRGGTLALTVDAGLQEYAARRLGPESGSVVVLDIHSGDILCMASMPSFDPNSFADGITHEEWTMMSENPRLPLLNKTLQSLYPPGSTVKPMVALALLERRIDPSQKVLCTGRYPYGGRIWHCWKRDGHGLVDMGRAVAQSCDVYFYHMGRQIGIDAIAESGRSLGLGEKFPLPFPHQSYGTMPDSEWKLRKYGKEWTVADTLNASIGQGYVLSNPLQLAIMSARIASGRNLLPRVILNDQQPAPDQLGFPAEHLDFVRQAMARVVNGDGTASRARLPFDDIMLAGKTGTAQVRRISVAERRGGVLRNEDLDWKLRDHGLFIAFAPANRPRYAASVLIQHGGGSSAAYPVARDVLTWLFDKRKAMAALAPLEGAWGGTYQERMARAQEVPLASRRSM